MEGLRNHTALKIANISKILGSRLSEPTGDSHHPGSVDLGFENFDGSNNYSTYQSTS